MVWVGEPFSRRVEFNTGLPTTDIEINLLDHEGASLFSDILNPPSGAVSIDIKVDKTHNTCSLDLFENRTLIWQYSTSSGLITGRVTYRVDKPIPFAVSAEGVRNKLGVSDEELRDDHPDLIAAYAEFRELVDATLLQDAATAGDRSTLLCINAIEALAALTLIPTMQVRIAQSKSGGTNEFRRFSSVDWEMIEAALNGHVDKARADLDPSFSGVAADAFIFTTATRSPDAITGS